MQKLKATIPANRLCWPYGENWARRLSEKYSMLLKKRNA